MILSPLRCSELNVVMKLFHSVFQELPRKINGRYWVNGGAQEVGTQKSYLHDDRRKIRNQMIYLSGWLYLGP